MALIDSIKLIETNNNKKMASVDELDLHMALRKCETKIQEEVEPTVTFTRKRKAEPVPAPTTPQQPAAKRVAKKKRTEEPQREAREESFVLVHKCGSESSVTFTPRLDQDSRNNDYIEWMKREHPSVQERNKKRVLEERLRRVEDNDPKNFSPSVPTVVGSFLRILKDEVKEIEEIGESEEAKRRISTLLGFELQAVFFEYYNNFRYVLITDKATGKTYNKNDEDLIYDSLIFKQKLIKFLELVHRKQSITLRMNESQNGLLKPASSCFFVTKSGLLSISKDHWLKLLNSFQ